MSSEVAKGGAPRAGPWADRARRFVFGDDVFVSYSRRDAADYALALASELTRRGLSCFLDQWGTPPGTRLPDSLKNALRGSTMLVLVGTERAAASENVREEVVEFLKTGRTIIPITFSSRGTGAAKEAKESLDGTLEQATWYDLIRGTSVTVESLTALASITPSPTVVDRIVNARGFTRRNQRLRRAFWGTLAATGLLLIVGAAASAIFLRQAAVAKKEADDADRKRDDAILRQGKAEKAEKAASAKQLAAERLERRSTSERLSATAKASSEDHPRAALTLAVEAVRAYRDAGDPPVADAEEAIRQALSRVGGRPLLGHPGAVGAIASSDDGRVFTASTDANVRAWDLGSGRTTPVATLKAAGELSTSLDLSPDGRRLVACGRDGTATLWDLSRADPSGSPMVLRDEERIGRAVFIPGGRRILTIVEGGSTAGLWDLRTGGPTDRPSFRFGLTPRMVGDLLKTPGGKADPTGTLHARAIQVTSSEDGRWVITAGQESEPKLFDTTRDDPAAAITLPGLLRRPDGVAVTRDGRRIAVIDRDDHEPRRVVAVWSRDSNVAPAGPPRILDHPKPVHAMALSGDGRWLATGANDQLARLWDLSSDEAAPKILKGHAGNVAKVAFSADGRWLATGSDNAAEVGRETEGRFQLQLWDLRPSPRPAWAGKTPGPAEAPVHLVPARGPVIGHVRGLAFSPDGHWLAARTMKVGPLPFSGARDAYLWRMNDGPIDPRTAIMTGPLLNLALHGHEGGLEEVQFTRDGSRLVTAGADGTARLWDLEAEAWAAAPISLAADLRAPKVLDNNPRMDVDRGEPTVLARGRWLVAAGQTARLWDLGSRPAKAGGLVATEARSRRPAVALDGRGSRMAVADVSSDGKSWELRLFDLTGPRPADRPISLGGHAGPIEQIVLDEAGRRMATAGRDGTVLAWDLEARPPTSVEIAGRGSPIVVLALSRDGRLLATAAKGVPTARLYDLGAARPADSAIPLDGHAGEIDQLVFTPDGRWLASRSKDGRARLRRLEGGGALQVGPPLVLDRPGRSVLRIDIGGDGRWMITHEAEQFNPRVLAQQANQIRLWDLTAGDPGASPLAWPFPGQTTYGFCLAPDGRSMVTPLTRAEIKLIESLDASPLRFVRAKDAVALRDLTAADPRAVPLRVLDVPFFKQHVAFSPDGRRLLSENQLVDLNEGADSSPTTLPLLGRNSPPWLHSAGFSPDGRWALLGVDDRVELHPVRMEELIALARDASGRNLTQEEWKLYLPDQPYRQTFPDLP